MNKHAGPRSRRERGKPKSTIFQLANIDIFKKHNKAKKKKKKRKRKKRDVRRKGKREVRRKGKRWKAKEILGKRRK